MCSHARDFRRCFLSNLLCNQDCLLDTEHSMPMSFYINEAGFTCMSLCAC